ncbi:hypothetical protein IE81DRAFT_129133 [Ceraceosorus guamensis]|uniref:Uncharacterized protein n=1 Tax=Ceraceosorus guamensis TaxID=1522189 RepID=A0A316WET2_9BASI|nr:hypothetical protein IE81DRAFT_129133 [Ceraceosorus guamensis]PWN45875.1 hypothetical protein IE81DRAFT_129133 [Ceraceosorus guamensis]
MAAPASKRPRLSRDQALADDVSNEPVSQALLNASRFANSVAPPPSHDVVWAANVPVVCAPTPGGVAVVNAITSRSCQLRPAHFDLAQHRQRRLPKPNLVSLSCSGTTLMASFAAQHDEVPGAPIAEETINLEPRARMVKSRTFCWVRSDRNPWNRWKEVALPAEVRDGGSEMVHASWCGQKADWRLASGLGDPPSFAEGGSSNDSPRGRFVQTAAAGPTPIALGSEVAILVNARGDVFVLRRAFSKSPFQLWRTSLLSSTVTLRSSGETLFETTLGDEEHFVHHRIDQIAACPVPGEPTLLLAFSLRATSQGLDSGTGSHDVTPDPLATSPNNAAAAALLAQAQISTTPNAGRTPGALVGTATSIGATHVLDDSSRGWLHLREIRVGLAGVHSEPFISTRTLEPISLAPSDGARPLSRPRHLQWHVPYPSSGSDVSASLRLFAGYSGDSDPLHTTPSSASIRSWRVERTSSQLVDAFNSLECKKSELPPPTWDWFATSSVSCELGAVKLEGMATSLSVNTLRICTIPFDVDAQNTTSESRLYNADTLEPVEGTQHRLPPGARYLGKS